MPNLTPAGLETALRGRPADPVYLLEGEEEFFHQEAIRGLAETVLGSDAAAVDRHLLQGDEIGLVELLDLASTYPMGGGRRLVVVREADSLRAASMDPLTAYLEDPNPRTCLVFSAAAFDRRRSLYRALERRATRVDCAALDETRTAAWVRDRLRGRGYGIGPDLAEAIAAGLAGASLARTAAEVDKLMAAIGAPRPVEAGDLAILADVPRMEDAFRLAAQIVRGETGAAVAGLRGLLEAGEEPVRLLGAIAWYARQALRAAVAGRRRLPPRELNTLYGIDLGRMARLRSEIGAAPPEDLEFLLRRCARADRELKGFGARDPAHAFELLIHAGGGRQGRRA
jgi:DNA polymerase-3 subunit delta